MLWNESSCLPKRAQQIRSDSVTSHIFIFFFPPLRLDRFTSDNLCPLFLLGAAPVTLSLPPRTYLFFWFDLFPFCPSRWFSFSPATYVFTIFHSSVHFLLDTVFINYIIACLIRKQCYYVLSIIWGGKINRRHFLQTEAVKKGKVF